MCKNITEKKADILSVWESLLLRYLLSPLRNKHDFRTLSEQASDDLSFNNHNICSSPFLIMTGMGLIHFLEAGTHLTPAKVDFVLGVSFVPLKKRRLVESLITDIAVSKKNINEDIE